jgi:hypothetical protein
MPSFSLLKSSQGYASAYLCLFASVAISLALNIKAQGSEYGLGVSFPIVSTRISDNYAWLPHNQNASIPVPDRYKGMPVQTLGDRKSIYRDFYQGCVEHYLNSDDPALSTMCYMSEKARFDQNKQQPANMTVSSNGVINVLVMILESMHSVGNLRGCICVVVVVVLDVIWL